MAKDSETAALNEDDKLKHKKINYSVKRDVYTQEVFIQQSGYQSPDKSLLYAIKRLWHSFHILASLRGFFPILEWLPHYAFKIYFFGDVIAGITVAVMHIPQGMAYGILAGVSASNGLYMAVFPVLTYMIFGTSKHISIGTFAVVSMMTLKVVQEHATEFSDSDDSVELRQAPFYTPLNVATATATSVGIIHLLMGVLRLGALATLLSDPLVNGFTTGAATHIVTSQLKDIFGIVVKRHKGCFKIIYTLIDVCKSIPKTNFIDLGFSVGVITFMVISNTFIAPWLSKKCSFPLPVELLTIIGGNVISMWLKLGDKIALVGNIPAGLPMPVIPPLDLIKNVFVDSIVIAVITYSVVMSMGTIFARKHSYNISPNQELLALGLCNIVGGAFSCIPVTCSLSRSIIQEKTGGYTQLASLVVALVIIMVLLWIGPFFESLPRCVLASVILVALRGMFLQAREFKTFCKQGKLEAATWLGTFLGVVILDIDYGLMIGLFMSLLTYHIKGLKSYGSVLGTLPETGIYVDIKNHKNATEVPFIKIYRPVGSINFATRTSFKKSMYKHIEIDKKITRIIQMIREKSAISAIENGDKQKDQFKSLIIDLSAVAHMDIAACKTITEIAKEMKLVGARIFLACPTDTVYNTLSHNTTLGESPFDIFPTVHDAVLYAKEYQNA